MKNLFLPCLFLACISFQSCKKNENPDGAAATKTEADKYVKTECYKAIYENDTVELKLNTLKDGKIMGDMVMKIEFQSPKIGEVKGEFHGDTLVADYTFRQGTNKDRIYKNPIALLKRDNQLIFGNGSIVTSLGVSYFEKGKPIDYDKVRFKFDATDCK
ncbi:hypothetical protein GON26_19180 [Flavobacterium sp. GA093]|uniref:Lipoprotein n=1 Tax=Flavobacterium hydrocarbonoxydans TaxID=2683249 RepID=A0A6I4NTU3_9FLAO|nr:hypothetical protein [Flavobacterium hydrocarbonoxydans]MWB96492.1 hypothetical protein [Flavobacterium hydrocarbonoxydans]